MKCQLNNKSQNRIQDTSKIAFQKAEQFLKNETQFHLGALPSEQSNPKTRGLDDIFAANPHSGIRMLQSVDCDIAPMAKRIFAGSEFEKLVNAIVAALTGDGRVIISSCGASGRLSIMLEACWRKWWQEFRSSFPEIYSKVKDLENRVFSIMTGGDYALVRSVEFFEDYEEFGRQQTRELSVGKGDTLIAVNEAGETSSVYGSVDQALKDGADVFLLFNNPEDVLRKYIERARAAIEDPRVATLELYTSPMAIAGSTRMQATTSELLVIGSAFEEALGRLLSENLSNSDMVKIGADCNYDKAETFANLMKDFGTDEAVEAIKDFILFEETIYKEHGMITYYANELVLDIFTDTTERSPTFMLPPYRKSDDKQSQASWAFVKNPIYSTRDAWKNVYGRSPRCLSWQKSLYYEMGAPAHIAENPPALWEKELYKFIIGNEDDSSRFRKPCAAVSVRSASETLAAINNQFLEKYNSVSRKYEQKRTIVIGDGGKEAADIVVGVNIKKSPMKIWERLAAKIVLNTVSTGTMARMGRIKSNWMSWVDTSNKKLIDRSTRLIVELADVDYRTACHALFETFEELENIDFSEKERPSPVQYTIAKIKGKN